MLWKAGTGVVDYYDKKHPVPFGEYVPDRPFWRQFAPDLIDLIQREYTPGTTDEVMNLGTAKSSGVRKIGTNGSASAPDGAGAGFASKIHPLQVIGGSGRR